MYVYMHMYTYMCMYWSIANSMIMLLQCAHVWALSAIVYTCSISRPYILMKHNALCCIKTFHDAVRDVAKLTILHTATPQTVLVVQTNGAQSVCKHFSFRFGPSVLSNGAARHLHCLQHICALWKLVKVQWIRFAPWVVHMPYLIVLLQCQFTNGFVLYFWFATTSRTKTTCYSIRKMV